MNKIDFGALFSKRQESRMSLPKRRSSPVKAMMHGNNAVTHGYSNQCKTSFHQLHQVLRTLVFFCDGMSWSYILPSGPTVLFRWFQPDATKSLWSILLATSSTSFSLASSSYTDLYAIYHYLESVIAVYVLGRCLGKVISKQFQFAQTRSNYSIRVARVVTATLFVHVFAAGIVPQAWTVVLRLVTAILAGMLCDMTSIASLGEVIVHAVWNFCTAAKVHWIGFVTCVLLTSFIRAHQAIFLTPLTVIGFCVAAKLLFSPFLLTGVAIGAEIILRFLFAFTPNHQTTIPRQISTTTTRRPATGRNIRSNSISSNRQGSFKTSRSRPSIEARTSRNSVSSSLRRPSRQSSAEPKPDSNSTNSSFSSLEESERVAHPTAVSYDSEVCIYRDRQCVYPDGTPAVSFCSFLLVIDNMTTRKLTCLSEKSTFPKATALIQCHPIFWNFTATITPVLVALGKPPKNGDEPIMFGVSIRFPIIGSRALKRRILISFMDIARRVSPLSMSNRDVCVSRNFSGVDARLMT